MHAAGGADGGQRWTAVNNTVHGDDVSRELSSGPKHKGVCHHAAAGSVELAGRCGLNQHASRVVSSVLCPILSHKGSKIFLVSALSTF